MCTFILGFVFSLFFFSIYNSFWIVSVTASSSMVIFLSANFNILVILTILLFYSINFHTWKLYLGLFFISFIVLSLCLWFFYIFKHRNSFVMVLLWSLSSNYLCHFWICFYWLIFLLLWIIFSHFLACLVITFGISHIEFYFIGCCILLSSFKEHWILWQLSLIHESLAFKLFMVGPQWLLF